MSVLDNIIKSFTREEGGWSGRKLTAFAITICVMFLHGFYFNYLYGWANFNLFTEVLIIDLVAIGFFLGLVTVQNIIELKNGSVLKRTTTVEKTEVINDPK